MTREQMEAQVKRRVAELAPTADEKTRWYAVFMIMNWADAHAKAEVEAAQPPAAGG